ncbi:TrmB family transcriptional regulator [Providencia rettgeri]|uniref:TrmB family transcriptional regulator n=1 Tax=Providencia rettgeri TaxID=587 RepID=UPI0029D4B5A0|nr:TrmB family transcriptional regulator [Providencia rettgeri]MDX7324573.1 TrmB family transcriptional regulator [Providencia rettgeri]
MLKQCSMTEEAKLVFNAVTDQPATVGEVSQFTELTNSCCQLILTQLSMAGLIKENAKEKTYQNI